MHTAADSVMMVPLSSSTGTLPPGLIFRNQGREPWFLKINPGGKVPVLDDNGTIITESAAVCMHLAERYPESRLLPPPGSPERTECYKWTSYILTELAAPLWTIAKHRFGLPKEWRVHSGASSSVRI